MNSDLNIGDKVILSDTTRWNLSNIMNPLNKVGVVIDDGSIDGWVRVNWDQDGELWNAYRGDDDDLILVEGVV